MATCRRKANNRRGGDATNLLSKHKLAHCPDRQHQSGRCCPFLIRAGRWGFLVVLRSFIASPFRDGLRPFVLWSSRPILFLFAASPRVVAADGARRLQRRVRRNPSTDPSETTRQHRFCPRHAAMQNAIAGVEDFVFAIEQPLNNQSTAWTMPFDGMDSEYSRPTMGCEHSCQLVSAKRIRNQRASDGCVCPFLSHARELSGCRVGSLLTVTAPVAIGFPLQSLARRFAGYFAPRGVALEAASALFATPARASKSCASIGCEAFAKREMTANSSTSAFVVLSPGHPNSFGVNAAASAASTFMAWCSLCHHGPRYDPVKMPECHFFARFGTCNNHECLFQHIDPESKIKDCAWYARGFCKHGETAWICALGSSCLPVILVISTESRIQRRRLFVTDIDRPFGSPPCHGHLLGPNCANRHRKAVICPNYLCGFCPEGPECPLAQ